MSGKRVELEGSYKPDELAEWNVEKINIVIPAQNGEKRIGSVLTNLAHQPIPEDVEVNVVVCANACSDRTAEKARVGLEELEKARKNATTHLIETSVPGQANALNLMIRSLNLTDEESVLELHDDAFPTMGAIAILALWAKKRPDLGAINVIPKPLPTYRKEGRVWERVGKAYRDMSGWESQVLVDRCCVFRPNVVGEIPAVGAVDSYIVYQSLNNSEGYGMIDDAEGMAVYYRLPNSLEELLKQRVFYSWITKKLIEQYPDFPQLITDAGYVNSGKSKIENLVKPSSEYGLIEKMLAMGVNGYTKVVGVGLKGQRSEDMVKRKRVASAI